MFTIDSLFLFFTGGLAAHLCWYFFQDYRQIRALHNLSDLMGFVVLLVSGLQPIFLGLGIRVGKQLLFFRPALVMLILAPLLFLMTLAFTLGFTRKGGGSSQPHFAAA